MRDNVEEELRLMKPDDETKQKMLDILKRFHSEEEMTNMDQDDSYSSDEADSSLSEETVLKILSGGEINFDDLSLEEKKRFQRAIASGELSKRIEPWDPWWLKPSARTLSLTQEGTQLIQPLDRQETVSSSPSDIPPGPETPLPSVKNLTSTKPSPLLDCHLIDILYSYCFTLRLYNGDWQSDGIGSAMVVLSVSSVLGQSGQPKSISEALYHCLEQTCSPAFKHMGGLKFGLGLLDDVASLLSLGRPALILSLCDLRRLIQAGEREANEVKPRKSEIRSRLKLAEKKIYFIMCWVNEQEGEVWSKLVLSVQVEKGLAMECEGGKRPVSVKGKEETMGKALIEEIY